MQKIKFILVILVLTISMPAAIFNTSCSIQASGEVNGCTAGDLGIQDMQIVYVHDGCTGINDTAIVEMSVTLNATGPDRYDIGMFINTAGGTSAATPTGGNECLHEALFEVGTPIDKLSGFGPYLANGAGECGDILSGEQVKRTISDSNIGGTNDTAQFEVACVDNNGGNDVNGNLITAKNGYVDFAWLVAYKQNEPKKADEICHDISSAIQLNSSKCKEGTSDTKNTLGSIAIGVPDMNTTISCSVDASQPNVLNCTVTYVNNSPNGPADYLGFYVDYNSSQGSISNISTPTNSGDGGDGTLDTNVDDGNGRITWTVDDTVAIKPAESGSFTFDMTVTDFIADINISIMGVYDNGVQPAKPQPSLYDEYILPLGDIGTLPVTIAYAYPQKSVSGLDVKFSTATETGNAGFNIYAIEGKKWTKLNEELIKGSGDSLIPVDYQASVNISEDMEVKKIGIAGVDFYGKEDRHGPFRVNEESGSKVTVVSVDWKKVNKQVKADKKERKAAKKSTKATFKDQLVFLKVPKNAVYRVTHEELLAAGIDLNGQKVSNIAISFRGEGVARHIKNDKKGKWGKESSLEFMGTAPEGSDALYLEANAYQIGLNKKLVVESKGIEALTQKEQVFEVNNKYSWTIPGSDPFYDQMFYTRGEGSPGVLTRTFDLLEVPKAEIELTVYLSGFSKLTHNISVALNGTEIGGVQQSGYGELAIPMMVDADILHKGKNKITITALGTGSNIDVFYYDKTILSYDDGEVNEVKTPVIELSDTLKTKEINPKKGTNYLIVSHPMFMNATLDRYVAHRESEGWKIDVINVEDIYAAYGYGMSTPDAIKAYLDVAKRQGVTHVQLVGAASYDYRDTLGLGSVSFIPSLYVPTGAIVNYTPCDGCLVADESGIPELAIGRWPVRTTEDLESIVNKTLTWTTSGQSASHTALMIADAKENSINFTTQMDSLSQQFEESGKWSSITRVYMDEKLEENNDNSTAAKNQAREEIMTSLNSGVSVVSFSGHSAPTLWSFKYLLTYKDASSVNNVGQTALALPLACYTNYADSPSVNTMAHQFLAEGENGFVAIYGAATLSNFSQNGASAAKVTDYLIKGETIGEAVLKTKRELGTAYSDVIRNSNLLGDVTLELK